jgi:nucleotide-binding universal stress UspA family protein
MAELFRKILSPVYFDETSPAALEYARHFARQNDGTVYLLHVVPSDELHLLRKVYRPEEGGGADTGWAEKVAREKLQTMAQEHLGGVRCEIITRLSSDPATGILETENALGAVHESATKRGYAGFTQVESSPSSISFGRSRRPMRNRGGRSTTAFTTSLSPSSIAKCQTGKKSLAFCILSPIKRTGLRTSTVRRVRDARA